MFGFTISAVNGIHLVRLQHSATGIARSVIITGQPGIGEFFSSVATCAL